MKLKDITISMSEELVKAAGVESPDEAQLEQDFASLAFLFIQDRAAQLMPYLLGFEVVEREEDGSKAVGIFGFKVGDEYYYVPSFFVNQQVKGMDLLFNRKANKFMPLSAETMDKILDRKALRLGQGMTNDKLREDFSSPDFDFVRTPPGNTKMASDWRAGHGHDAWNDIQDSAVASMREDSAFRRDFASALAKVAHTELEAAGQDNALPEYLENFGGPEVTRGLLTMIGRNVKLANAAIEFYGSLEPLKITEFSADLAPVVKQAEVEITTEVYDGMGDGERKRLVTHGIAVADNREPEAKSKLYDTDYAVQFSNPCEGGRYEVLLSGGSTVEADVLVSSDRSGGVIVVSDDGKMHFTAEPSAVFVRGDRLGDAKAYDKAVDLDKLETGERYILVRKDGASSDKFSVRTTVAESGKEQRTSYKVWFDRSARYTGKRTDSSYGFNDGFGCNSVDWLRVTDDDGRRLRQKGDTLIAPASEWKALEVPGLYDCACAPDDYACAPGGDADGFVPGNPLDFEELLYKNAIHRLDVEAADGGSTFYISLNGLPSRALGVKQALSELVCRFGLSTGDADTVMKSAAEGGMFGKVRKLVKFAQLPGVSMPMPPYAPEQTPESHMGVPVQNPEVDLVEGQTLGLADPRNSAERGFAVGGQLEQEVAQLAEQAAQSGQKHVFDHATIGGLARLYDTSAVLDQYLPEMQKSLDRIGRVLFMFYWKNEAFEERYGAADLADMEDLLRSVFKSYGRLLAMLEQKSIAASDGADIPVE